jgi:CSLREA domain-containing protein
LILVLGVTSAVAVTAQATEPRNDLWADRVIVNRLPFSDVVSGVEAAQVEATDPSLLCRAGSTSEGTHTLWYSYTTGTATEYITISTTRSTYDTIIGVYTGTAGEFRMVSGGCNDDGVTDTSQSRLVGLRLQPNTTYMIMAAAFNPLASPGVLSIEIRSSRIYRVTKTADTADGVCDSDCSLREAITAAGEAPGAILLPAGLYLLNQVGSEEEENKTGDFDIQSSVAIYGEGAANTRIDADQLDRIFHIDPAGTGGYTVILEDLTLTNGSTTWEGGAISTGFNTNDFISLDRTAIAGNRASQSGGALRIGSRALIRNTTISGNTAGLNGGGIAANGTSDVSVLIEDTTISGNTSLGNPGGGGGIYSSNQLLLENVTISSNAANTNGGGILIAEGGTLKINNVTIFGNQSDANRDGKGTGGGIRFEGTTIHTLTNSIIAGNRDDTGFAPDCSLVAGELVTSYSHITNSAGGCIFVGVGDVVNTAAGIDAFLANNGGSTLTHALLPGSPAIDTGNPAGCATSFKGTLMTDQRGYSRVFDGDGDGIARCDKGAYEVDQVIIPTATFTATDTAQPSSTPTPTATDTIEVTPEPSPTPAGLELVVNGGFENDLDGDLLPDNWEPVKSTNGKIKCNTETKIIAAEGNCSYHFKGVQGEKSKIRQQIDLAAIAPTTLRSSDKLHLYSYVDATGNVELRIKVFVQYVDENLVADKITVKLLTPTAGYQLVEGDRIVTLQGEVANVTVQVQNRSTSGRVRIDGLSLKLNDVDTSLIPLP